MPREAERLTDAKDSTKDLNEGNKNNKNVTKLLKRDDQIAEKANTNEEASSSENDKDDKCKKSFGILQRSTI